MRRVKPYQVRFLRGWILYFRQLFLSSSAQSPSIASTNTSANASWNILSLNDCPNLWFTSRKSSGLMNLVHLRYCSRYLAIGAAMRQLRPSYSVLCKQINWFSDFSLLYWDVSVLAYVLPSHLEERSNPYACINRDTYDPVRKLPAKELCLPPCV